MEENLRKDFNKKWQKSKMEMNETVCQMQEEKLFETVKSVNLDIGREVRVNEEIMLSYEEFQKVNNKHIVVLLRL